MFNVFSVAPSVMNVNSFGEQVAVLVGEYVVTIATTRCSICASCREKLSITFTATVTPTFHLKHQSAFFYPTLKSAATDMEAIGLLYM